MADLIEPGEEEEKEKEKFRSYSKSDSASRHDVLQNLGKPAGSDRSVYKIPPNTRYRERGFVVEHW
jgi:hypothetical protein